MIAARIRWTRLSLFGVFGLFGFFGMLDVFRPVAFPIFAGAKAPIFIVPSTRP
jgi:hypothetical protein